MSAGTGRVIPVADAQQVRIGIGLNLTQASDEARKRGIDIKPGVIRGLETGRQVANPAKLLSYLRMLAELQESSNQATAVRIEPDDRTVAEQIVGLQAQQAGLEHFLASRLDSLSVRDAQLLSGALHIAYVAYRNAASLLQGAVQEKAGGTR